MRRAQRRGVSTSSMLHRSGNSPLHPSGISRLQTVAAYLLRSGQALSRDPAEPDYGQLKAQTSCCPEDPRVAPIVLVAFLRRSRFQVRHKVG
jgi:hypothetical protein